MLNKRQARYLRDYQPFMGTMTFANRKEASNEAGRQAGDKTSYLGPQFHCFGMAKFRPMHRNKNQNDLQHY
jgi:hypothetical protein